MVEQSRGFNYCTPLFIFIYAHTLNTMMTDMTFDDDDEDDSPANDIIYSPSSILDNERIALKALGAKSCMIDTSDKRIKRIECSTYFEFKLVLQFVWRRREWKTSRPFRREVHFDFLTVVTVVELVLHRTTHSQSGIVTTGLSKCISERKDIR